MSNDNFEKNKRMAKNSIFLSIRMVFILVINLYTTRAVLNFLGVVDYGIYNVVCGFVSMFTFLNMSMSNGIQRFYNYELGKNGVAGAKKVFILSLYIQLALAVFIILLAETIGLWYLYNKMVIPADRMFAAGCVYQFSVLSFVFVILQAPFCAAVMAHEKMDFFSLVGIIDALLKLMIVFLAPFILQDSLISYGFLWAMVSLMCLLLFYVYAKKNFSEIQFEHYFSKSAFTSMLSFSGWNVFGALSGIMRDQGINLILNMFFGPIVNAANAIAAQVNAGLQSFVQNITIPVRPQVIQSYAQGDIDRTLSLTYRISKLSCCFLYLVSLPVVIEIDYVLDFWLRDNVPVYTGYFVIIIVLTSYLANLNSAISGVVHASGKMKYYQIAGGLAGFFSMPVAYLVLLNGGAAPSALWVVFSFMVIAQINALLILKTIVSYSIKDYIKYVIQPFVCVVLSSCVIPLIIRYSLPDGMFRFLVVLLSSLLLVSLSIFFIALDEPEKQVLYKILRRTQR